MWSLRLVLVPLKFGLGSRLENTSQSSSEVRVVPLYHYNQCCHNILLLKTDSKEILRSPQRYNEADLVAYALIATKFEQDLDLVGICC